MSDQSTPQTSLSITDLVQEVRKNYYHNGKDFPTHSYEWRVQQLQQLKKMLQDNASRFSEALHKDLRSNLQVQALEVENCISEVNYMLNHLKELMQEESRPIDVLALKMSTAKVYKDPYGVVLIISPFNYPISLLLRPLAGAIAAGNAVICKPSELSENCSNLIAELFPKYMDQRLLRCVTGAVQETTELLTQKFNKIFYTGSTMVGKIILKAAAEYLTPVELELGGKSPCIIDKNVGNMDVIIKRLLWAKYQNVGQTCVAVDYILCHKDMVQTVVDKLKHHLVEFFGTNPQEHNDYPRIINQRHTKRVASYLDDVPKDCIIHGGKIVEEDNYMEPTILLNPPLQSKVMQEEIFGPILPILTIDNTLDAVPFINERPEPLSLYICSSDKSIQNYIIQRTVSGSVCVNDFTIQILCPSMPFGGVGTSGMGKGYNSKHSFDCFTHEKSVLIRNTALDSNIRYPPFTEKSVGWLVAFNNSLSGFIGGLFGRK